MHFERDSLELSQKIYALRDAFKEVVTVASGRSLVSQSCTSHDRIPTLTTMCAIIAGNHIETESVTEEAGEDDPTENATDALYEMIPTQYRR